MLLEILLVISSNINTVSLNRQEHCSLRALLCCTVLYCTVLYCTVLYCTVLCCTVLCCTVLCCTVLCCASITNVERQAIHTVGSHHTQCTYHPKYLIINLKEVFCIFIGDLTINPKGKIRGRDYICP